MKIKILNKFKIRSHVFFLVLNYIFTIQYSLFYTQTINNNGGFITAQSGSFIHVNGSVMNNSTGVLSVNGNGTSASSELYVTQDITNNSTINANGYIRLLGNWYNNALFNSTIGTVFFEGANQFLGGTSVTEFFNITLDGTGIKTQQVDKIANGTLDLKSLHLNTDSYEFYVTNPALNAIQRTTGFVSSANGGYLSRATANTGMYLFPTGSNANSSLNIPGTGTFRYRPIELNPNDNANNIFSVRMANLDASLESYDRNNKDNVICEANPKFYHQINRIAGSSTADIGVCYIPSSDGNWNDLARWNININGIWQDIPNIANSNISGFSKVTATNWSNFNDIPYILSNLNPTPGQINTPISEGCSPLQIILETIPTTGVNYNWLANGVNIGSGNEFNEVFNEPGCYDITLTTSVGNCAVNTTISDLICVLETPVASFSSNENEINGSIESILFFNNSVGANNFDWSFGSFGNSNLTDPILNVTNITENILVTLIATSPNGCVDSSNMIIYFKEDAIFYVPNSFTPDQDEFNQTWGPVFTKGYDPFNFDLFIFNRWGELIWESHDATARWDGTYGPNRIHCPDGVYSWKINYKSKDTDEKIKISGHLTLIR